MLEKIKLNSFEIRIIAMVTMVFDHVGYHLIGYNSVWYSICRNIGRVSFVLFAFLIVEGMYYTKNEIKYLARLFSLAVIVDLLIYIGTRDYFGNAVTILFLGALSIYFLKKDGFKKIFVLIPIALCLFDYFNIGFIQMEYEFFGIVLILLMYISTKYLKNRNLAYAIAIIFANAIYYLADITYTNYFYTMTLYNIFSIAFILLYNHQLGLNGKFVRVFNYLFYPLHVEIILVISMLIN